MAGGRPKGSTNHQARLIREMISASLDKVGGTDYFARQAIENPTAYMTLVGKVLPLQVSGDPEAPIVHTVKWEE